MRTGRFFAAVVIGVLSSFSVYAADITIGTGTIDGNFPMDTSYCTERVQCIYLASEIGSAKTLTSLALNVMWPSPSQALTNFTIRLKHTNLSAYEVNSKWDSSGWTTVYQANQNIYGGGWKTFTFTTPFSYNGVQNLIVDFSFNNTSSSTAGYCQCSTLGTLRSLFYTTSSSYGNPLAWSGYTPTPSTSVHFLNLRLGYLNVGTGSGTAADPYQIWMPEQFSAIGLNNGNWNKYYILMADLDMQGVALTPIGNSTTAFTGAFNGNQHVIRNATINVSGGSRVGLFGYVGSGATVFNLGVEFAAIAGQSSVGILAGSNYGTLSNCYTTGTVTGSNSNIGGLVGSNQSTVSNCYAIATVTGGISSSNVGGLIGNVSGGTVINCYAAGTSTGGGLIGYLTSGTVTGCFWDAQAYGLTGIAGSTGKTTAQMQDINTYLFARWDFDFESINGVQNIWTISPDQYPRFAWQAGAPEDIVIVPGVVSMTQTAAENAIAVAGLTVWVTNVYSDTVAAGTVITQSPAVGTSLLAGMPVNISVSLGPKIAGSGTEADPYRIGTVADWQTLYGSGLLSPNYVLIADLDFRFVTLKPIDEFRGFLNGSGHVIRNATISTPGRIYIGLFGDIDTAGRISYLGLESVTATATGNYAGGLAGRNYGTIHNCYAAGTITGGPYTGGLVGANYGILDQCYADGTVTADSITSNTHVGGLVGYNYGSVNRCYAMGTVTCNRSGSPYYAGGLIGRNYQNSIHQCYATGAVTGNVIGNPSYIGGLIGYNENGGAYQCYATGSVSGRTFPNDTAYVGGLVGYGGSIDNCYATGSVSLLNGTNTIGGLVGSDASVSNSYSIGAVITSPAFTGGGLVGFGHSTPIYDSFWDTQTSGRSSSGGGTGKTTEQMQNRSTFADAGWDFADETANGTEDIWMISSGQYPRFIWQGSIPGSDVLVPNVTSLTQAEAENALGAAGLAAWVVNVYNGVNATGMVINQNPAVGTTFQSGMPVKITVNLGQEMPGNGTETDPYRIGTITDWRRLMNTVADWNKYYILIADLDLRFVVQTPVGNSTTKFTGSFNGNGHVIRNAMINTSGSNYVGLFGYIDTGGRVFDLQLESVVMNGSAGVGGLAGTNSGTVNGCDVTGDISGVDHVGGLFGSNGGTVSHCTMTGTVTSKAVGNYAYAGGLMGSNANNALVSYCSAGGTVSGYSYVGGLVGYNYSGRIEQSYSTGTIIGSNNFGGLVGYNVSGSITRCYSTGIVKSYQPFGQYVGGLVGYNASGSIEQSYATGSVIKSSVSAYYQYVGGLAGFNQTGTIKNCYSAGDVSGSSPLGGFIGSNQGTIGQCYSTGYVKGSGGGFCGPNSGTVTACFWDTQTSGKTTSGGGTGVQGKTTAEMMTLSTFTSAEWDFSQSWIDGDFQDWILTSEGTDYPKLKWQFPAHYSGGAGTAGDPYQISSLDDFWSFLDSWQDWDKHFILTVDIDLGGIIWTRALISPDIEINTPFEIFNGIPFTGSFDGNGHTIMNLNIQGGNRRYFGLFGQIGAAGQVKNLSLKNSSVAGDSGSSLFGILAGENRGSIEHCSAGGNINGANNTIQVGGLAGKNSGSIQYCCAVGAIRGGGNIGGLVGDNGGSIFGCYAAGSASKSTVSLSWVPGEPLPGVGGLVGSNEDTGNISNSYATSSVSKSYPSPITTGYAGGLAGTNYGTIGNCYSNGPVSGTSSVGGLVGNNIGGNIANSFWDIQTSGQPASDGGAGKTTAQMKTLSTFTSAGWNFINGTNDNLKHIWFIREGQEYPRLMWEIENGQNGLFPEGFVTINKTRVGRTSFEYELAVRVRNSNAFAMNNVQMKLMDWDAAVQSVSDDSITIDTIPAGATVTSADTFKIVVNRSTLISSSRLTWELTYYTVASGDQVQQAMMSMLLSDIDAGVPGDISGDGKVNFDDFAILAGQWDAAPGNHSADIAIPRDGYVGIEDLMYLAENWLN